LFDNRDLPTIIQKVSAGDSGIDLGDRVPGSCYLDLWIQVYPGVSEASVLKEFAEFYEPLVHEDEVLSAMPPTIEKKMRFLPGTGIAEDHPILDTLIRAEKEVLADGAKYGGAPFAADSFMFNLYSGTPAVILGPSGGNAHSADEFINVDDYLALIKIYAWTIVDWCGLNE
jgi:acetylornithine deacetylase